MNYNIDCLISNNDQTYLQNLIKSKAVCITMAEAEYTPAICLTVNNNAIYIVNNPILQIDKDEYPKIILVREVNYNYNWRCLAEGIIKKIVLIRDEVTWEWNGNLWRVIQDIGLKIYINNIQIVIFAVDSIGGLLECLFGDEVPIQVFKRRNTKILDIQDRCIEYCNKKRN